MKGPARLRAVPSEVDSLRTAVAEAEGELAAVEVAAQEAAERRRRAVALQVEPLADEVRVLLERKGKLEQAVRDLEASVERRRAPPPAAVNTTALPGLVGVCFGGVATELALRWLHDPESGANLALTLLVAGFTVAATWLLVARSPDA